MIVSFHCKFQSFNFHNVYQVSGGHDRVIHVWDVETSTHLHTFTGHRDSISVGNMSDTVLIMRGGGREEGGREVEKEGGREGGRHTFTGPRDSVSVGNMSDTVLIMREGEREGGRREGGVDAINRFAKYRILIASHLLATESVASK